MSPNFVNSKFLIWQDIFDEIRGHGFGGTRHVHSEPLSCTRRVLYELCTRRVRVVYGLRVGCGKYTRLLHFRDSFQFEAVTCIKRARKHSADSLIHTGSRAVSLPSRSRLCVQNAAGGRPSLLSPSPPTPCIHSRCDQRFLREYALGPVSDPEDGVGDDGDASGERALAVGVACVPKIVSNTESTTP